MSHPAGNLSVFNLTPSDTDGPGIHLVSVPAPGTPESTDPSVHSARDWSGAWPDIQRRLAERPRLLLALEFDGILAPIVSRPSNAKIPEEVLTVLGKLAAGSRLTLAVLSGRSLTDLHDRVGLEGIYYVGNHGTEVRGPGMVTSDGLASSCRSDLVDALAFLAKCAKRVPGVFIEDKGMTVSVHWRMVDPANVHSLREWMELFVGTHPRLTIVAGEACWDLRARAAWSKADAVQQILVRCKMKPEDLIFVGRESSEPESFSRLSGGLTISLGECPTPLARYTLGHGGDVAKFLFCVLCAVNGVHLK